jgi:hypothetical protein
MSGTGQKVWRTICTLSNRRRYVFRRSRKGGPAVADRMPSTTTFHRSVNDDGTFDCLCTCCFRTVAFAIKESYLGELERNHICEDRLYPPINPRQIVSK